MVAKDKPNKGASPLDEPVVIVPKDIEAEAGVVSEMPRR